MHKTSQKEYLHLLNDLGVKKDDIIMMHADLRMFGRFEGGFMSIINVLQNLVGPNGLLVTPAFTFSFPGHFDIVESKSNIGALTSLFAQHPDVKRSPDGMTSYFMIGNKAFELINNWDNTSYGLNSIIGQMEKLGGKVLQFDTDILSLIHYVEQLVGVPYREIKRFEGLIKDGGSSHISYTDFYARVKDVKKIIPDPIRSEYFDHYSETKVMHGKTVRYFEMKDFILFAKSRLEQNRLILVE